MCLTDTNQGPVATVKVAANVKLSAGLKGDPDGGDTSDGGDNSDGSNCSDGGDSIVQNSSRAIVIDRDRNRGAPTRIPKKLPLDELLEEL